MNDEKVVVDFDQRIVVGFCKAKDIRKQIDSLKEASEPTER